MIKLDKYKDMARYWQATRVGNGFYTVEPETESFCGQLELVDMHLQRLRIKWNPMPSFLGSDEGRGIKPLTFFHDCYRTEYLKLTYQHTLVPINGEDIWEQAPGVDV